MLLPNNDKCANNLGFDFLSTVLNVLNKFSTSPCTCSFQSLLLSSVNRLTSYHHLSSFVIVATAWCRGQFWTTSHNCLVEDCPKSWIFWRQFWLLLWQSKMMRIKWLSSYQDSDVFLHGLVPETCIWQIRFDASTCACVNRGCLFADF